MNLQYALIVGLLVCIFPSNNFTQAQTDDERIELTLQNQRNGLIEMAERIATRTGGDTATIRGQLETLAIYNEQRSQYFSPNWTEAGLPSTPDRSILSAVPRVKTRGKIRLNDIDSAILEDEKFLSRRGNASNLAYVRGRLDALKNVRKQAIKFLEKRASELSKQGDEIMLEQASSFDILESEARQAEKALAKTATSKETGQFSRKLSEMRSTQQGRQRAEALQEIRSDLISTITDKSKSGGDYEVLVVHIRTESWGGIGYKPGDQATLSIRDTYSVVSGPMDKLEKSKTRWYNTYNHGWCRFTGGAVDKITRASVDIIARQNGIASKDAGDIRDKASDLFKGKGFVNNRLGFNGPLNGLGVPFTVPQLVSKYPKCK